MAATYARYRDVYLTYVAACAPYAPSAMRVGLGAVILLAGVHKLVEPAAWTKYAAPWVTALWPEALLSFELAMALNGAIEILFGLTLLAGSHTTVVAGVVALSMLGVVLNLAAAAVVTGKFVDVLIRDVGLTALALGVTLLSADRADESEERA